MEDRSSRRRGGSLVIPFVLIVVGVLLLLDNLNVMEVDWGEVLKLWPLLLVAIGLEIIFGRRISAGTVLILVIILVVGGLALWWSDVLDSGNRTTEQVIWPMDGAERAQVELDVGVGKLELVGSDDMSNLLIADLDLAPGVEVSHGVSVSGDVAQGSIVAEGDFVWQPFFGEDGSNWDVRLNEGLRWELDASSAFGDVKLDLTNLRIDSLQLDSVAGSIDVSMPERGAVRAKIDGGAGDVRVTIPSGAQARIRVDQAIGDVNVSRRFEQRGEYYETEGFTSAESFILLEIDHAIGSVTIR
jgi:hypothetical protein